MHIPVLIAEIIEYLDPRSDGIYLDGTLGSGGYSEAILEASGPNGRVVAVDLDRDAIKRSEDRLAAYGDRFKAYNIGFHEAKEILDQKGISEINGVVLDLGLSSEQLDTPMRGFSFRFEAPLDMRFNTENGETALDILKQYSAKTLEEILANYGEERYCKKLARGIHDAVRRGRIETTKDLTDTVEKILHGRRGKIHPATRVFQALRIAVNKEMENLNKALEELPHMLTPGSKICVVSYHSLEDRAVKFGFRALGKSGKGFNIITKSPITPGPEERRNNPRSRSAKLRILEAAVSG